VNIALVLVALFVLGTAETFADVGGQSLVPRLVDRRDLGIANARLTGAVLLTNQLIAPPIGAFLFVVGMALPFGLNAIAFVLGAVLVSRMVLRPADGPPREPSSIRADMAEGLPGSSPPPMRTSRSRSSRST